MASPPAATRLHRSSGDATPPGYRQLMPTIAIGSSAPAVAAASSAGALATAPNSSP